MPVICIAQDIIIKNDKTEIKAKVLEITDEHVKYKEFDFQDGPIYNLKKSEIFVIIYKNGKRETFPTSPAPEPVKPAPVQQPAPVNSPNTKTNTNTNTNTGSAPAPLKQQDPAPDPNDAQSSSVGRARNTPVNPVVSATDSLPPQLWLGRFTFNPGIGGWLIFRGDAERPLLGRYLYWGISSESGFYSSYYYDASYWGIGANSSVHVPFNSLGMDDNHILKGFSPYASFGFLTNFSSLSFDYVLGLDMLVFEKAKKKGSFGFTVSTSNFNGVNFGMVYTY